MDFLRESGDGETCTHYVQHLARELSIAVKGSDSVCGIELFPKKYRVEEGQFGNAIRASLGVHRAVNRRHWFTVLLPTLKRR